MRSILCITRKWVIGKIHSAKMYIVVNTKTLATIKYWDAYHLFRIRMMYIQRVYHIAYNKNIAICLIYY